MHNAIETMLQKYNCQTSDDYKNALKEIVQETALSGLYRAGFFQQAAFYGGTALRIFYGLDRFSEDLDFSLLKPDKNFDLSKYEKSVRNELGAFGFEMTIETKKKIKTSAVQSAFIKGSTQIHLLKIKSKSPSVKGVHKDEQLKIKFEIDTDPPAGADFEIKYHLNPTPFSVQLFAPSSLFAGKVHAVLYRSWQTRVKGRDFYDYIWFLKKGIPLKIRHLEQRAIQSGNWERQKEMDKKKLKEQLFERFNTVDFEQAKKDIMPFIKDHDTVNLWSAHFFITITNDLLSVE